MSGETLDLEAIEARANAATPAERMVAQRYDHGGGRLFVDGPILRKLIIDAYHEEDREFYFAARTDIPALVAEVRRLREDAARLDWVLADCIGEADEKAKFTDVYLPMLWVPTDKGVTPESLRAAIDKRIATGEDAAREAAHD